MLFPGMLTGELKRAAFVDAALFILPSRAGNFSRVIIEVLACGLPVVISDQVNIHRELSTAGAATVVQCLTESVAAGIEVSLADPAARSQIATVGTALVRAHYTWDTIIPTLVAHYAEATGGGTAGQESPS